MQLEPLKISFCFFVLSCTILLSSCDPLLSVVLLSSGHESVDGHGFSLTNLPGMGNSGSSDQLSSFNFVTRVSVRKHHYFERTD